MAITKGFIKDFYGNTLLPITRGELVLDANGNVALTSEQFLAGENGNKFGLITAAERAMLTTGTTGGGISDLYTKLDHVNNGLQVNGQIVNFYDALGTKTPINLVSSGDGKINVSLGTDNTIVFGLSELTTSETSASQILKNITVDKYGRVTAVTGEALVSDDLPKTISDKIFSGCVTADSNIGTNEKAIVNKAYVDAKFQEVTGIATGALKFSGVLSDATVASNALANINYLNSYFKVSKGFKLPLSSLHDTTGITGSELTVKAGDTLIVYSDQGAAAKFVYIPSGDDTVTTISVYKDDEATGVLNYVDGDVTFKFSSVFSVTSREGSKEAYIALPPANSGTDGYLSKADWTKFNSYASNLATTYTGLFSSGDGVYQIGTLSIGGVEQNIYGKNNISSLVLNNGAVSEYNPILKFTETGTTDVDITFAGLSGIVIKKNGNVIEFAAANEVLEQDVPQINNPRTAKYLTITNGSQFGVQLGSVDKNGKVTDGLTDFSQFNALVTRVASMFDTFDYSLNGEDSNEEYRYGNTLLKDAIKIAII